MKIREYCNIMMDKIKDCYETGVTTDEAESLATEFLYAMDKLSQSLQASDLDTRMKKSGVKAIRAAVYTEIVSKSDKKPTVDAMEHMLNMDEVVNGAQMDFDIADSERQELERCHDMFREAHIHFRGIAKGGM